MSTHSSLDLNALEANRNLRARNYWKQRLDGFEFETYFDQSLESTATAADTLQIHTATASPALADALGNFAPSAKAQHIVLLAALGVFTQKYASCSDVCLFTASYASSTTKQEGKGVFPLRMDDFQGKSFRTFLLEVKDALIEAIRHSDYPLDKIMENVQAGTEQFPAICMLLEGVQQKEAFDGISADLLFCFRVKNEFSVDIYYRGSQYDSTYIASLADRYFFFLEQVLTDKESPIEQLPFLRPEEKEQLTSEFNNTHCDYQKEETIVSLFEKQVQQSRDRVAVVCGETRLTYGDLSEYSEKIAWYLQNEKGVGKGDLVGVMLQRDTYLIPSIYGILKAGAAYVPIDPNFPPERIRKILGDSNMKVVFTRAEFTKDLEMTEVSFVDIEASIGDILSTNSEAFQMDVKGTDLACISA
ncbi:MAG: AMP-binding protein [Bacteroidota bacterium]